MTLLIFGCFGRVAPPASAATIDGANELGSFTIRFADAAQVSTEYSTVVPVTFTWTGNPSLYYVTLSLDARPVGSSSRDDWIYDWDYGKASGTSSKEFRLSTGAAEYLVTGYVRMEDSEKRTVIETPVSSSFTLSRIPTGITLNVAEEHSTYWAKTHFSGTATAYSTSIGTVGADGRVSIQQWNGSAWAEIDYDHADQFGNFSGYVYSALPAGARVRAVLVQDSTYSESVSNEVSIVGPPPTPSAPVPSVNARAVSSYSKLFVDVNPNVGRSYWKFKVEKKQSDGSWKAMKTIYKTSGSKETRTINLSKGLYRVLVLAQRGYATSISSEVFLRK